MFSIQQFKTNQFFKQQKFSVQQRESDQIQLFMMLRICLLATHFCHRVALFVGVIISNVMLYKYQNICRFFHFYCTQKSTNKMPKQNLSLTYQVSNLDIMGLWDIKTRIFQCALCPSNRKCNIEHEPNI